MFGVRFWHLADIGACIEHVRFRRQSGHSCLATLMFAFDPNRTFFLPIGLLPEISFKLCFL